VERICCHHKGKWSNQQIPFNDNAFRAGLQYRDYGSEAFRSSFCGELRKKGFNLVIQAWDPPTEGYVDGDITLRTRWDAGRLDLGRVRITPRAEKGGRAWHYL
jgi:hypothetical protein